MTLEEHKAAKDDIASIDTIVESLKDLPKDRARGILDAAGDLLGAWIKKTKSNGAEPAKK